jgi:hypothetical protein
MTDSKLILPGHHQPRKSDHCESAAAKLIRSGRQYRQLAEQYNELLEKSKAINEANKSLYSERMLMVDKLAELGHDWDGDKELNDLQTNPPVEFFSDTPEGIPHESRWELDQIAIAAQQLNPDQAKGIQVAHFGVVEIDGKNYNRTRFTAPPA